MMVMIVFRCADWILFGDVGYRGVEISMFSMQIIMLELGYEIGSIGILRSCFSRIVAGSIYFCKEVLLA